MAKKEQENNVFSKSQFLESKDYRQYKDFLSVVLSDKRAYSKEQVNNMIDSFYKKGGK